MREFNVLTDTYGAEYGKRAGAQVSVVTQSGDQCAARIAVRVLCATARSMRATSSTRRSVPPFRRNQFGGALGGPLQQEQAVPVRQLRRIPAGAGGQQRERGPGRTRRAWACCRMPRACIRRWPNLNPAMLQYMSLLAAAQRSGAAGQRPAERDGAGLQQSEAVHSRRFRHRARRLHARRAAIRFAGVYTIDDGNSLIPLADPLFASYDTLRVPGGQRAGDARFLAADF